jgi:hypothetical protein
MRVILVAGAAAATLLGASRFTDPGIGHIETVNFSNLMSGVTTPYVAPGQSKEYYIYGPWVDWADKVTFLGATQTIVEKRPFVTATEGLLRVRLSAPSGTSRGKREMAIHISCGLGVLGGCKEMTLIRQVMVLRVSAANSITPNSNVVIGQPTTFTVSGSGLDVATIFTFRTGLSNTSTITRSPNVFQFRGTPTGCGTFRVFLRDEAEGGDFYPFSSVFDVGTSTACGYTPIPKPAVICPIGTAYDAASKSCIRPDENPASSDVSTQVGGRHL